MVSVCPMAVANNGNTFRILDTPQWWVHIPCLYSSSFPPQERTWVRRGYYILRKVNTSSNQPGILTYTNYALSIKPIFWESYIDGSTYLGLVSFSWHAGERTWSYYPRSDCELVSCPTRQTTCQPPSGRTGSWSKLRSSWAGSPSERGTTVPSTQPSTNEFASLLTLIPSHRTNMVPHSQLACYLNKVEPDPTYHYKGRFQRSTPTHFRTVYVYGR